MDRRASTVQEWFSLNQEELIHCPHQLGNLKISKSSCLQQRRRSGDWAYGSVPDNYILYALEMHLKVCRQCDRMAYEAAGLPGEPRPNGRRFPRLGRSPGRDQRGGMKESAPFGGVAKQRKEQSVGNDQHYRKQRQSGL